MATLIARLAVGLVQLLPILRDILHEVNDAWEKARKARLEEAANAQLQSDMEAIKKRRDAVESPPAS